MRLYIITIIITFVSLACHAQIGSWPLPDADMKAEQQPLAALPEVVDTFGMATLRGHLVGAYQMPDSISLHYFMGTDTIITHEVSCNGDFFFQIPLPRTCGAFLDNRCYLFLSPNDTTEIWLSEKSPLVKKERRVFVRGPLASLICDINNTRSQYDVLRSHLLMDTSDILEYMTMEKSVTDLLKTAGNIPGTLPPLVMDEILLVSRNPKIIYSRYYPDVLRLIRQSGIVTSRTMTKELKFANLINMHRRGEHYDPKELLTLPQSYQQYLETIE